VLAWSAVLIGTMLYGAVAFNVVPSNVFTVNIQKIGGALEVMLLSFALGDRIATLNAERDAARTAAMAMERDLAVSATVQRLFLPREDAFESPSIALRGFYSPAAQSGGDWWWYEADDDGRVRVLLGDVTGHGVGAAMVTAAVAAAYRAMPEATRRGDVRRVIDGLNESLADICAGAHHMTLGALEIDPRAGVVRMWSAGAPAALVLHRDGKVEALAARGSALGAPSIRVGTVTESVSAGDRIFVFSDGLSELDLANGRPLGYRGVTKMLQSTLGRSAAEAVELLAAELRSLVATTAQQDDIAFVIVDVLEQAETRKAA
jgi:sigma-B regulation protein RsbU (phosphoserine phosphatase)